MYTILDLELKKPIKLGKDVLLEEAKIVGVKIKDNEHPYGDTSLYTNIIEGKPILVDYDIHLFGKDPAVSFIFEDDYMNGFKGLSSNATQLNENTDSIKIIIYPHMIKHAKIITPNINKEGESNE